MKRIATKLMRVLVAIMLLSVSANVATAQDNPFESGWTLQPDASSLNFQSIKKQTVVESSSFATMSGTINETGQAEVVVLLDSVDTKIDLRNVRMRFLFFETFKFPEAKVTTQIDSSVLADLKTVRRKTVPLSYTMSLHGVEQSFDADVVATLLTDDLVSISTKTPISVSVSDFGLMEGLQKLQEAANVDILPSATVSFDMMFARNAAGAVAKPSQETETEKPASAALETAQFDAEACKGRFEILSRTGNIYFKSGSARLETKSAPLLNSLADIVSRCPGMVIEVGGHTDSVGGSAQNQRLSLSRANSVTQFLLNTGLTADRMVAKGYGEDEPIADNSTKEGRWKNRRIGFKVLN
jgi:outer membrane protein OmpA-like peptidoglycan-associated protein